MRCGTKFSGRSLVVTLAVALSLIFQMTITTAQEQTMRQYQLEKRADSNGYKLVMNTVAMPAPGNNEVLVRVHAAALNGGLETEVLEFTEPNPRDFNGRVPLSDAAGEVVETGDGVTRFKIGDRVTTTYIPAWIDGALKEEFFQTIRFFNTDGVLSEYIVVNEQSLIPFPDYLSYEEASTFPTAGLTAWNGLIRYGNLQPGQYVLLEGTGGVSSFGLVFSVAVGAKPIMTSSSDEKLERAKKLGAIGTVNYKTNPDWEKQVRELTGGTGVNQVLEVGGKDTLEKALNTLGFNGHVALIGQLSGFYEAIPLLPILRSNGRLTAIYVGSRTDFEAMNEFISKYKVKPVIERVFEFEDAPAAFDLMAHGSYMGKIVIRVK